MKGLGVLPFSESADEEMQRAASFRHRLFKFCRLPITLSIRKHLLLSGSATNCNAPWRAGSKCEEFTHGT